MQETLERAARGDGQAWRLLIEGYSPRVFALLVKQCRDRDLAEELTQATFVTVVTKLADYTEQGRFEPWLFRIAMNKLRDEMRRRKRQAVPVAMTAAGSGDGRAESGGTWAAMESHIVDTKQRLETPLERMSTAEQVEKLREAIATLPEADQELLHLRHTAGLSFAQIAETLQQPLGTVLARGHRALGKLRKLLNGADETDD